MDHVIYGLAASGVNWGSKFLRTRRRPHLHCSKVVILLKATANTLYEVQRRFHGKLLFNSHLAEEEKDVYECIYSYNRITTTAKPHN